MTKNPPTLRQKQSESQPSHSMQPPAAPAASTWEATEQRVWPINGNFLEPAQGDTLFSSSMFSRNVAAAAPAVPPKVPETPRPAAAAPQRQTSSARRSLKPEDYTKPFCDFLTDNPTVFHAVVAVAQDLEAQGYKKLSERDVWKLDAGGKYFVERNGSSLIAFAVGEAYEPGNGAAILAGHIDALTAKLKPIPKLRTKAGYEQLGVAPYAGALNSTWWDRDLGIGGRVLVKEESGKVVSKLVKLDWPIARIPTLAPHFGAASQGPFNKETQMVPIIGLDNSDILGQEQKNEDGTEFKPALLGGQGTFTSTQPERLVKVIAKELGITDYSSIVNWELELFDTQPAQVGGIDKEFIFAGRVDDKLCSWAAVQALLNSTSADTSATDPSSSSIVKVVGLFDDEEIGSLLRQGARGNFLPSVINRIVDSFAGFPTPSLLSQTFANSFLVSSDVIHAVNPNFLNAYLENHSPRLNVGLVVSADSNGHMTTDAVSTAILQRIADKSGQRLQVFQIRNDSRSGGTVGPMLSAATGIRAIDAGIPQLSMHSIRATTGSLDPGLGVAIFQGFLDHYEAVDQEFRETV
ncbi:Aspartyl aminopeptidase [Lasiodiplodia theobromae]|uniref:Vacuolar aminopeptidase 1 n=1 Tax=Lasiodiplodia theobromae TaxID=45133 RepID=A0A5N5DG93_9PEZI|nr:Aspartyl aminopeptidase [Lasiodiplodia theobromae]KAB2576687.1 Vacuolar aminopeptidase 1 [Lasiodiplodia theobromae]KAF4534057.1 Aspartyl aminopeptidase [Lasiodiplodia theobromae]